MNTISQAAKNQPGNQSELLKLVTHLPTIAQKFLPYPIDSNSAVDESDHDAGEMFKTMAKEYTDLLKQFVHIENKFASNTKPQRICEVLENLTILGGSEFAKKKLVDVLSHEAYSVVQGSMELVEDLSLNLETVEKNIVSSVSKVKILALTSMEALFLCEQLKSSYNEQMNIVSNTILEKLSTELLMVVDSMKEGLPKDSTLAHTSGTRGYFLPQKGDALGDACFSSSNLVSLSKIIDCFLDLEKALQDCHCSTLQKFRTQNEQLKKSALKQRSKLPDILRSSQEASWIKSVNIYGDWDWQEVLKNIGPIIIRSIAKAYDDCQTKELNAGRRSLNTEESNTSEITTSLSSAILCGPGIPKKSLQCFKGVLELMISLLPYATLGSQYRPLCGLTSSYTDECNQILKAMKFLISMAVGDFPEKIPVTSLYAVLATCEDVCAVLGHCALKIGTEPRMAFQGTLQSYQDMVKSVKSTIIQYLTGRIRGCILHDSEGDHYRDPKEYGEGDSCSHSVGSWKQFLERLWQDLTTCVSDRQCTEIFDKVFLSSLKMLESRYLKCEPSYNRRKQLPMDLDVILSVCQSVSSYHQTLPTVSAFVTEHKSKTITSCCDKLISVMCLVAGPLDIMERSISSWENSHKKSKSTKIKDLTSPGSNSTTFSFIPWKQTNDSESLSQCLHALLKDGYSLLDYVLSDDFPKKLDNTEQRQEYVYDIYKVLAACSFLKSDAFFHCAYKSVAKNPQKLLKFILPNADGPCTYPWQEFISDELGKILCQSLSPAVTFLCHPTWSSLALKVILSDEEMKGIVNLTSQNRTNDRDCHLTASIVLIIQSLAQALYQLPEWLVVLFACTQSELPSTSQIICNNVPLHVLINAARKFLDDPSIWDQFCYIEFTKEGVEAMQQASKILSIISQKDFERVDGLDTMRMHLLSLNEEIVNYIGSVQDASYDYTDQQLLQECSRQVADMMDNSKVMESLKNVGALFLEHSSLPGTLLDNSRHPLASKPSALSSASELDTGYNWKEMCNIALTVMDWESVKVLVSHRWEMKEGASLNDGEAKIVGRIKMKLFA